MKRSGPWRLAGFWICVKRLASKGVKGIGYMQPFNYIKEGLYNSYEKAYVVTERDIPGAGCVKKDLRARIWRLIMWDHWQTLNEAYEMNAGICRVGPILPYAEAVMRIICWMGLHKKRRRNMSQECPAG